MHYASESLKVFECFFTLKNVNSVFLWRLKHSFYKISILAYGSVICLYNFIDLYAKRLLIIKNHVIKNPVFSAVQL